MSQHILLNIIEKPEIHIDIVSHYKSSNNNQWCVFSFGDCRVNVDPTNSIGVSTRGKMIVLINHTRSSNQGNECNEAEIVSNSFHLDFLSTEMSIDDYIKECNNKFIYGDIEVVVRDGDRIVHMDIEDNEFDITTMNSGLYLYAYNKVDVNKISPYFDGWLYNLIKLNRKYDENLRQIFLRVGYCEKFNLEKEPSNSSTIMVIFLRDRIRINEICMKKCLVTNYSFDKNNNKCIHSKEVEQLDSSPDILNNWDSYDDIIKEYTVRFTFLPNPTSIKTRGLENKNKLRNHYSAYTFYAKDIRPEVEEEYLLTNTEEDNLNKDVINRMIGDRWKSEPYETKHLYEMFATLDKLRYLKEANKELKYPYSLIDEEKNNYIKEYLISKICHYKLLFDTINQPLTENAKYLLYYYINIGKYKEENKQNTIDNISMKIYNDFMELSDADFDQMIIDNNFNLKNIPYDVIDDNALKYLPSKMCNISAIKTYGNSSEENDIETNEENGPVKRKRENEENEIKNKCMKTSKYDIF